MPTSRPRSRCRGALGSWDDGLLLSAIATGVTENAHCDRLSRRNWGFPSFRDLLTHEIFSEYDASLLAKHVKAVGLALSDDFRSFERSWLADELRHHRGFRHIYAGMYGDSIREIDATLARRSGQFEAIYRFLEDEFGLLVLLGYDEIVTTKAYARDFPIYDSFERPEISRFIRLVARDEAFHFQRILEMLGSRYEDRISELPAMLDLIVNADKGEQSYRDTFVLDHHGFPSELLASASTLMKRLVCGRSALQS